MWLEAECLEACEYLKKAENTSIPLDEIESETDYELNTTTTKAPNC